MRLSFFLRLVTDFDPFFGPLLETACQNLSIASIFRPARRPVYLAAFIRKTFCDKPVPLCTATVVFLLFEGSFLLSHLDCSGKCLSFASCFGLERSLGSECCLSTFSCFLGIDDFFAVQFTAEPPGCSGFFHRRPPPDKCQFS